MAQPLHTSSRQFFLSLFTFLSRWLPLLITTSSAQKVILFVQINNKRLWLYVQTHRHTQTHNPSHTHTHTHTRTRTHAHTHTGSTHKHPVLLYLFLNVKL